MNKKNLYFICALILVVLFSNNLFAEAPELKNVMPNSWKKVARLAPEEEAKFLSDNKAIIEKLKNEYAHQYEGRVDSKILPNYFLCINRLNLEKYFIVCYIQQKRIQIFYPTMLDLWNL
jgi:hypothetical protein